MTATSSTTTLFELDELTPAVFDPDVPAATLTAYGRHHGLGPGIWDGFGLLCGDALYGSATDNDHRVWFWHACSRVGLHTTHHCDRCEETW